MLPLYILKGKSPIYLNGKRYDIICNALGIKTVGITPPVNNSPIIRTKFTASLSFKVNKVMIWINNIVIHDINKAKIRDIINNIKLIFEDRSDNLNGSGNNKPIIIIGKNLKRVPMIFLDIILINQRK